MNKIIVEVIVPSIGGRYDVLICDHTIVREAISLISLAVEKQSKKAFRSAQNAVLCDKESGRTLDINVSFASLGIKNGEQLILI